MAVALAPPVAFDISAFDTPVKAVPKSLVERLTSPPGSPPKESRAKTATALREIAVNAVKARATLDIERAKAVAQRREKRFSGEVENVSAKLTADENRLEHRLVMKLRQVEEAKQKREEAKQRVIGNRAAADSVVADRAAAQEARRQKGLERVKKTLEASVEKAAYEVNHAKELASTHKEKTRAALLEAGEKLEMKLEAAASRRQDAREAKPPSPSTSKGGVRHRIFNDAYVAAGLKRRSLDAAMERAASKRESVVQSVKEKASQHCLAVREKVSARNESFAAAHKKSDWSQKMVGAELARHTELKKRYGALGKADKCPQLVLVGAFTTEKAPPPSLLDRLASKPSTLLATAESRQAGAAARRGDIGAKRAARLAQEAAKVAAAATRRGASVAAMQMVLETRHSRSAASLAAADAAGKRAVAAMIARRAAAAERRRAADEASAARGKRAAAKCEAAAEKGALPPSRAAKAKDLNLLRATGFRGRREAESARRAAKGAAHALRCEAVEARRKAILAARVAKAAAAAAKISSSA